MPSSIWNTNENIARPYLTTSDKPKDRRTEGNIKTSSEKWSGKHSSTVLWSYWKSTKHFDWLQQVLVQAVI